MRVRKGMKGGIEPHHSVREHPAHGHHYAGEVREVWVAHVVGAGVGGGSEGWRKECAERGMQDMV